MPIVNRYTQLPQPLRLNPLSFEELSRVPLAKAQEKAEGLAAINRISTDFNVDAKDLGYISNLVQGIDSNKNSIVDNIANNGVDTKTVSDVINLKRERDELYKTKINQAEENKKRIEAWKQQVDQLYAKEAPWYANLVKQKEYGQNWTGSFDEEGNPKVFQGSFGEKYFDVKEDFFKYMEQAKDMTQVNEKGANIFIPGGGVPQQVQVGDQVYSVTQNTYRKRTMSNEDKLKFVVNELLTEYNDPTTERGKFKQYAEISNEDLLYEANQAYNVYRRRVVEEEGGGKSYGSPQQIPQAPNTPFFSQETLQYAYKVSDELKKTDTGNLSSIVEAYKETQREFENTSTINKLNPFRGIRMISRYIDNLRSITEGDEASRTKLVKDNFREVVDELHLDPKMRAIAEGYPTTNLSGDERKKIQLHVIDLIKDYVDDHSSEGQQANIMSVDQMKTNYGLEIKSVNPDEAAEDLTKGGFNLYPRNSRMIVNKDKDEFKDVIKAMLTGKAEIQGVAPMFSPDLNDENGDYIPGMSSAYKVVVKDSDNEDIVAKEYYIQQPSYLKNTPQFRRMEEVNKIVKSLPMGDKTKLTILLPENGTYIPKTITVKHTGVSGGDYRLYFDENTQGISLNSDEGIMYSAALVGPEYLNELIKTSEAKLKKKK